MKKVITYIFLILSTPLIANTIDPNSIDIYVTPYFDTTGPKINIGQYSEGLATEDEEKFLATIWSMKDNWSQLSAIELHVGAIQLYNMGYLDESIHWFYSAQQKANIFKYLLDPSKIGTIGSPAFELRSAHNSFYQLAGQTINGYAFSDLNKLKKIVRKVKKEEIELPYLLANDQGISFIPENSRLKVITQVKDDFANFIELIELQGQLITAQRKANGIDKVFKDLKSKKLSKL